MRLSEHFDLEEFTKSETAEKNNVTNQPTAAHLSNLKKLANSLEKIRELVGKPIVITSGYRSKELNKLVGGVQTSAHCQGLAADIHVSGMTPKELANRIVNSDIEYDQVIHEFGRWVHFGLNNNKNRKEKLTATKKNGRTVYLNGIV
nr:MAG TPA: peptidase [Caudoviricetes sp.]